jgi:putative aldouronate transport system permease protein
MVRKTGLFDIINTIILLLIAFLTLYPFINILFISISPVEEVVKNSLILFPKRISLDAYQYVFKFGRMGASFKVTIFITLVGTLINLALSSLGAYALSTRDLPGRKVFTTFVVITIVFNGGLIPTFLMVKNLYLYDTVWALILPNAINSFWLILMRNFFQGIPDSLRESARIDGCSEYRILGSIILPLSLPIIATLSLFYGVAHWNEYYSAIIYTNKLSLRPLQVVIRAMYTQAIENLDDKSLPPAVETVRASTIIIATLPILFMYPFLQKYFVQGIMVGAVKG